MTSVVVKCVFSCIFTESSILYRYLGMRSSIWGYARLDITKTQQMRFETMLRLLKTSVVVPLSGDPR